MRLFDPTIRATSGSSAYAEVLQGEEKLQHPVNGSALLGETVRNVDESDARLIIASNGGSDLIYVPGKSANVVHETLAILMRLDNVGSVFVGEQYCPKASGCPGALPMSAIGMVGHSHVPRPEIVVAYRVFNQIPGDLQSAVQGHTISGRTGHARWILARSNLQQHGGIRPRLQKRLCRRLPRG